MKSLTIQPSQSQPPNPLILFVDDNVKLCETLEKNIAYQEKARITSTSNAQKALLKIEQQEYLLILVDLRLEKGEKGKESGLRLIEQIAPQTSAPIILFTSNPHDQNVQEKIRKILEKYSNFIMAVEKTDAKKLQNLIHTYLQKNQEKEAEQILIRISSSLRQKLENIGQSLNQNRNKRYYEEGKSLHEAREAIEQRRQELKELMMKDNSESLRQESEALSGVWSFWLGKYVGMTDRSVLNYVNYYTYFSEPRRFPYLENFNVTAQRELVRNNILSEEEQQYLIEQSVPPDPKQIRKYTRIRKHSQTLPKEVIWQLSQEPLAVIDNLLNRLPGTTDDLKLLEEMFELSQKQIMTEKFFPEEDSGSSTPPMSFTKQFYYTEAKGEFEDLIGVLQQQSAKITTLILDLALMTPKILNLALTEKIQLLTLPINFSQKELDTNLSYLLLGSYVVGEKIIIYPQENFEKIRLIFQDWQTNQQYLKSQDPTFFSLLQDLQQQDDVYLLCS